MTTLDAMLMHSRKRMKQRQGKPLAKHGSETMRAAERTHAQPGASQSRQSPAPRPQSMQQG